MASSSTPEMPRPLYPRRRSSPGRNRARGALPSAALRARPRAQGPPKSRPGSARTFQLSTGRPGPARRHTARSMSYRSPRRATRSSIHSMTRARAGWAGAAPRSPFQRQNGSSAKLPTASMGAKKARSGATKSSRFALSMTSTSAYTPPSR